MNIAGVLTKFRLAPRIIVIIYAIVLIFASLSVAAREGKPEAFFIDGIGAVITGADKDIYEGIEAMKADREQGTANWWEMLNVLGAVLLMSYIIRIFKYALGKSFEMSSPAMLWVWSLIITFLFQTLFYSVTTGELIVGFRGLFHFLLNMDTFFFPIHDLVVALGEASARSPIF